MNNNKYKMNTGMFLFQCIYFKILIFYVLINVELCMSGGISSKIDFGPDEEGKQHPPLNRETLKAVIDTNRGFIQQMPRRPNYNGGRPSYKPQDGNFVRNDNSFPGRGQGNMGRNNVNNRPVINYIRVFMNGQNPNPCEEESCNLTLVKKQLGNGRVLTNVYINMDKSQIDAEGEQTITIKVTPLSQGSSKYGPSGNYSPNGPSGPSGPNGIYGQSGRNRPNDVNGQIDRNNGPNGRECSSGNCNFGDSRGCSSDNCHVNSQGCSSNNCPPADSSNQQTLYNPQQSRPGNSPSFAGNPGNFQSSVGASPGAFSPFGRPPGLRFYPQRSEFLPSPPHPGQESPITSKEIVDDKIEYPLSKTNHEHIKSY